MGASSDDSSSNICSGGNVDRNIEGYLLGASLGEEVVSPRGASSNGRSGLDEVLVVEAAATASALTTRSSASR